MKKKFVSVLIFCICTVLLASCGAAPAQSRSEGTAVDDSAVYQLVNNVPLSSVGRLEYSPEHPAISDTVALADGDIVADPASIQFYNEESAVKVNEVKAIWISYLEMDTLLTGKTEAQFRSNISRVFDDISDFGLNTVIVQVRPFGDALYPSEYFPWSYIVTGTEGQNPGFDPLQIMVAEAKNRGLRFEAWINPYRVRASGNTNALSSGNQAQKWLDAGDSAVIRYNGMISYNPASEKARNLIVDGIREIVRNYNVDAIHIDDYFYPTTDMAFDQGSYNAYKSTGGAMTQADWRRDNVETLIKQIYSAVKAENANVLFGISPQGNVDNNYNGQFLDVKKIVSTTGYCDYICPQVYYGFQNDGQPFAQVVQSWNSMIGTSEIDLYIGIAVYKLGSQDSWAGQGRNEWLNTSTILAEMVQHSRNQDTYGGFVLYRYDSLFRPASGVSAQVGREFDSLKQIL